MGALRHRPFAQVDVFTATPYRGNPVAVVLDGSGLSTEAMQRSAHWTNLSETTFVLPPQDAGADYCVRIFTPTLELAFAGHPTLGTCHAWLEAGGRARDGDTIVQECAAGPIRVRRTADGLAFAAPPLVRSGAADAATVQRIVAALGIGADEVVAAEWVDNGPGWVAVLLESAAAVLAVRPGAIDFDLGVVGQHPDGAIEALEVRAFFPKEAGSDGSREVPNTSRRTSGASSAAAWTAAKSAGSSAWTASSSPQPRSAHADERLDRGKGAVRVAVERLGQPVEIGALLNHPLQGEVCPGDPGRDVSEVMSSYCSHEASSPEKLPRKERGRDLRVRRVRAHELDHADVVISLLEDWNYPSKMNDWPPRTPARAVAAVCSRRSRTRGALSLPSK